MTALRFPTADPALMVAGDGPVFVDEYQHVVEMLDAIKAELNRDLRPGRFVLAGTTTTMSGTDSGGVPEETTALGVACLTLRDETERPITVTEGT